MKHSLSRLSRPASALLAVLLLAGVFSGCSFPKIVKIGSADPNPAGPETDPPETEAPETLPPEIPDTPEIPDNPEDPGITPPAPDGLLTFTEDEFSEPFGSGNCRRIKVLPFSPTDQCALPDGRLFAYGLREDGRTLDLAVVDPDARTVLPGEAELPESTWGSYCDLVLSSVGGLPLLFDAEFRELILFDSSLHIADRMTVDTDSSEYVRNLIGLPDGSAVFAEGNHGKLRRIRVDGEGKLSLEIAEIPLPEPFNRWYFNSVTDGGMLVGSISNDADWDAMEGEYTYRCAVVDPGELTFRLLPDIGDGSIIAFGPYLSEQKYASGNTTVNLHLPGNMLGIRKIEVPEGFSLEWPNGSPMQRLCFVNGWNADGKIDIQVCDPDTLALAGELHFDPDPDGETYPSRVTEIGEKYAILLTTTRYSESWELVSRETNLVFWTPDPSDVPPTTDYLLIRENPETEIRQKIAGIYEDTGISVYVGDEAVRYLYGYAVRTVSDPAKILAALAEIGGFFDKCPPGFLKELVKYNSGIDICLTGTIIPEIGNENSINDASAFVSELGGIQVMVLDIQQYDLARTVSHEFLHIAENTIFDKSMDEPDRTFEFFSRWEMLNPPDFEYHWVYTDENGNTLGSDDPRVASNLAPDGDVDGIYFVDGYSTTYPSEDRARIFENLATFAPEDRPAAFSGKNMQLKAAYLCAALRDAYDSIAQAEDVFWEHGLNAEYTLDWFRENYDLEEYWSTVEPKG